MKTKFLYVSDLHLEFFSNTNWRESIPSFWETNADILFLAGDICTAHEKTIGTYEDFLRFVGGKYNHVLLILGNHEYYAGDFDNVKIKMREMCDKISNVHLLDPGRFDVVESGKLRVLGLTLWSNVPEDSARAVGLGLNDYRMITRNGELLTVEDTNRVHEEERQWLLKELTEAKREKARCVVVTHHAPIPGKTSALQYRDSPMHSAFAASDMDAALDSSVVEYWVFGHTHHSCSMKEKRVKIVANQLGYKKYNEKTDFTPTATFQVKH